MSLFPCETKLLCPTLHALHDDEILQVSALPERTEGIFVYLWQHQMDVSQLLMWTKQHAPHLLTDEILQMRPKRLIERLSVLILLHQLLPSANFLAHLPSGAPYLPQAEYHISISHTQGCYGLSFSHWPHGIDLEKWGEKALRVRSMFVRDDELTLFDNMSPQTTAEQTATLLWSAKESIYKLFDIPGLSFRDDMQLAPHSSTILKAKLPRIQASALIFHKRFTHFAFTCALCTDIQGVVQTLVSDDSKLES